MAQLLVEGGEPERNLQRALDMIDAAQQRHCDAVLLPETLDLGWTHPSARTEAQSIPGPHSELLCARARQRHIYVCAGLTERADDRVYNSAVLIGPDGDIILHYRKINVLDVGAEFYAIGDRLGVVETPFGVVGMNICSDNYMDGLAIGHALARMGAQLILSPSSWTVDYSCSEEQDPYGEKWIRPYSILAELFNLVVVGTTSVGYIVGGPYEGRKMVGCSLAVGPDGLIARGRFNEFAGELIEGDIDIPQRSRRGTDIGDMILEQQRFYTGAPCA